MHLQYLFIAFVLMSLTAAIPLVDPVDLFPLDGIGGISAGNLATGGGIVKPLSTSEVNALIATNKAIAAAKAAVKAAAEAAAKPCFKEEFYCKGFGRRCFRTNCPIARPKTTDEIVLEFAQNLGIEPGDLQKEHVKKKILELLGL